MTQTIGPARVAAVVLAAGGATRFGGAKLLATLDGRPMLQHVLEAVRVTTPAVCVVVLGAHAERLEAAIDWMDEVRVRNPAPEVGLASSLRMGVDECLRRVPDASGVLVVLGDQPRTSPRVMLALADAVPAATAAGAWAVLPRYAEGGGSNPALLLPPGIARVADLHGDRGLGVMLSAQPGRAHRVAFPGSNPDVDTPADLAALGSLSPTPTESDA